MELFKNKFIEDLDGNIYFLEQLVSIKLRSFGQYIDLTFSDGSVFTILPLKEDVIGFRNKHDDFSDYGYLKYCFDGSRKSLETFSQQQLLQFLLSYKSFKIR